MALLLETMPDGIRKHFNRWRFRNFQMGREMPRSSIAAFDYYRCIFVHIPKTGGISVNDALWGNPGGVHKSLEDYARIFSPSTLEEYYKFTFVRNPWDRLVSAFLFLKAGGLHKRDARWAARHISEFRDFDAFVKKWLTRENIRTGIHFIPQAEFLKLDGKITMDFIGRMETIDADFETVKTRLGLKEARLQHKNRSSRKDFREYYSDETRRIVEEVYREDVDHFGYAFDNA